jgi:hypothetical protein
MSWWKQHQKAEGSMSINESLDALHSRFAKARDIQVVRELAADHDTPEEEVLDHVCNSAELVADLVTVLREIEAGVSSERAAELAGSALRQAT